MPKTNEMLVCPYIIPGMSLRCLPSLAGGCALFAKYTAQTCAVEKCVVCYLISQQINGLDGFIIRLCTPSHSWPPHKASSMTPEPPASLAHTPQNKKHSTINFPQCTIPQLHQRRARAEVEHTPTPYICIPSPTPTFHFAYIRTHASLVRQRNNFTHPISVL